MCDRKIKLLIIGAIALLFIGCASNHEIKSLHDIFNDEEVNENSIIVQIEFPSLEKNDLFINSIRWFIEEFHIEGSELKYQDKEAGIVLGDFIFVDYHGTVKYLVKQNITLEIFDGIVKLTINNPHKKSIGALFTDSKDMNRYADETYDPVKSNTDLKTINNEWNKVIISYKSYIDNHA